jgi:hypothetical protein
MERVMVYIEHQAGDFTMMQSELFNILDELFNNRFKVGLPHFNDHIYGLLPKHPENSIFNAFVADQRFHRLVRGVHDERKAVDCKKKCEEHLRTMPPASTLDDAQRALGIILFECVVCKSYVTKEFITVIGCGHPFCTSCVQKIDECSICRVKIGSHRFECSDLKIRYKKEPDELSSSQPLKKSKSSE